MDKSNGLDIKDPMFFKAGDSGWEYITLDIDSGIKIDNKEPETDSMDGLRWIIETMDYKLPPHATKKLEPLRNVNISLRWRMREYIGSDGNIEIEWIPIDEERNEL